MKFLRFNAALLAAATAVALLPGTSAAAPTTRHVRGVRIVAEPGTTLEVPGLGRYVDTLEVRPAGGGLRVVNELGMDPYVEGLGEMPASWPLEALKAQAVAARTYAWYSMALGTFAPRGYDICATVACQVFDGRRVVEGPDGGRWARAVEETAGEVLVWDDEPILARFFSSSGGHTRANEEVYGWGKVTEGKKPYLVGVADPDEKGSPHHRWGLRITRAELDRLLSEGKTLGQAVPVRSIRRVPSDGTRVDQIRVEGQNGRVVELSASKFRAWISEVAPRVLPHRFPIRDALGRPMPDAFPSSRMDFSLAESGVVVIVGRGWGHGVGMSQWGARGKSERGLGYDEILAAYYNGLKPERSAAMPERVRVGLRDGGGAVTVRADGPHTVIAGGEQARLDGGATWNLSPVGGKVAVSGAEAAWAPAPPPPPPARPQVAEGRGHAEREDNAGKARDEAAGSDHGGNAADNDHGGNAADNDHGGNAADNDHGGNAADRRLASVLREVFAFNPRRRLEILSRILP